MSFVSSHNVKIEWGDCDPARIVFYPNYFAWFDAAAHLLFDRMDLSQRVLMDRYNIIGYPIADASARFVRPSRWGESIEFQSRVESWKEKFFTVLHQGYREGQLLLEGREVRFFGIPHPQDAQRLQTLPIPGEVLEIFAR